MKKYYLQLFVGITMFDVSIAQTYSDSIRMDSIIHNLPDIMVTGEHPVVKVAKGKLVYDMNRLNENKGVDNVYEAIKGIPTIDESGSGVTLAGKSVMILVDGRRSSMSPEQLTAYLKALPADRLKATEVLYTAPAKYHVRGAVINLILDNESNREHSVQGQLQSKYLQEHNASFVQGCNVIYKNKGLSMDVLYNYNHNDSYRETRETSIHTLDDNSVHDISTRDVLKRIGNMHLVGFDLDYQWSEKDYISFVYNGNYGNNNAREYLSGNIVSDNSPHSDPTLHDLNLSFGSSKGIAANIDYTSYTIPSTQDIISILPTGTLNFRSREQQRINRWSADFSHDFSLAENLDMNTDAPMCTASMTVGRSMMKRE